jgi:hypothetical protein
MPMHPHVSKARARVAAMTRAVRAGERTQAELADAKRNLAAANIAAYIEKQVARAPEFTTEQVDHLHALLEPVRAGGAPDAAA